jgi:hypothetical protein
MDLVPSWNWSQAVSKSLWHITLLCVQWKTPDDGQRSSPKHVEFHSKKKVEKLLHLACFIIRNSTRCTVTWTSNREQHILKTHKVYFELNISAFRNLSDTCCCQSDGRKHLLEIPNKIYGGVICGVHVVNNHWPSLLDIRGRQIGVRLHFMVDRCGTCSISIIHWCFYSHSRKICVSGE